MDAYVSIGRIADNRGNIPLFYSYVFLMKTLCITLISLLLSSLSIWSQAFQFTEDFQTTPVGQAPSSLLASHGGQTIEVVGGEGTLPYKDPFEIEGNRSLLIWDAGAGTPRASWTSVGAGIPLLTAGTVAFDFYMSSAEGAKSFFVFFGQGNSASQANTNQRAFNMRFFNDAVQVQDGSSGYHAATNFSIAQDQAYSVRISFQESAYEVYIKEFQADNWEQVYVGENSTFGYSADWDINYVQFTSAADGGSSAPFYIDNFQVTAIPEGAFSVGLTGALILGYGLYRRRKSADSIKNP